MNVPRLAHLLDDPEMRMSGRVGARRSSATIDGVAVTDLLAYWRSGHGAKGA